MCKSYLEELRQELRQKLFVKQSADLNSIK